MQTFISETIQNIAKKHDSFNDVVLILPSQRAKVFVKQALKNEIAIGFLPEILNIEEFVSRVSNIKKVDFVELLFHLYSIYKEQEPNADSFDVFSSWAITVLQDFNEIDQHLVNTNDIFVYIRDIQRLRKWSTQGTFQETDLMKDHYKFLEKLNELYTVFYQFLVDNQIGYQGVLYREATKKLTEFIAKNKSKHFYFIGFNALNASEEYIFQEMLSEGNTNVFWDIDKQFLGGNHQAGNFIRKHIKSWKYYEQNELQTITNHFSEDKKIQVIGASKNITQIKYAGEILSDQYELKNTALVMADESLLPIALNSLPQNVDKVNITMGYPLKDMPTTHLIFLTFQLFLSQERFQKTDDNLFYYKDVVNFIKHPAIFSLISKENKQLSGKISTEISINNHTFVNTDFILSFFDEEASEVKKVILAVFEKFTTVDEFSTRILSLINELKDEVNPLEKEFLFRYFTVFTQIQNLQKQFGFINDLKTLQQFFRQLIAAESVSFQGEPLEGLQIMGMLETRVLDFENLIITSLNEGILPANSQQNSFIPFDVKVDFGLPTYREKDAIFSYHFFRLLQRAKNVYLLYNTETDSFGKGEKSRFITQLELLRSVQEKTVSPKVVTIKSTEKEVDKNELVLEKLQTVAQKGISPSALATYLYNPIQFYQQKVLDIKQLDEVEETVAMNTLGTVVHDTLDDLYSPFIDKFLTSDAIKAMKKQVNSLVEKHFAKHFKNGDITTGKNRLIFEVANRYVLNFLKQEYELLKDESNALKIIATEQNLETSINVDGLDFSVKIRGQVDRVDELNGAIRIIDYKTGMVQEYDLKITDFEKINDYKYHKSIQVLLYAFMYVQNNPSAINKELQAGIISFKNLKNGFLSLNFSEKRGGKDGEVTQERLSDFMDAIKTLLIEIYNVNIPFVESKELTY